MLDDRSTLDRFASRAPLPEGYGVGFDERVVEYPWFLAQTLCGRLLDAGSTLNHPHVLDRVLPRVDRLDIVTLAPEAASFPERGVSYLFADLRDLPLRNDLYDVGVSISTLEHVGMDNSAYGDMSEKAEDPAGETARAAEELRRVIKPDGILLVTVPYGRREDHGWLRQFDTEELMALTNSFAATDVSVTVYAYSRDGWQLSSLEAAGDVAYQPPRSAPVADDGAVAARAVACIAMEFGG